MKTLTLPSTKDPRLTDLVLIGGGEGFGATVGKFEGRPALVIDSTMAVSLLDEDDRAMDAITVLVFDSLARRAKGTGASST